MKFNEINMRDEIKRVMNEKGFDTLTDIQKETIPLAIEGKDIIGQAQTGSGKTIAFSVPLLNKLDLDNKKVQGLVLVPTRELALQVKKEIEDLGKHLNINVLAIFGGDSMERQLKGLKSNPQVVVATPGRCIDLIDRNKLKVQNIKMFILDEVDEMLNMGFIDDVEYISSKMPETKQTLFFSATMPDKIKNIAKKYLVDPTTIKVKSKSITADRVEQFYIMSKAKQKKLILKHLIDLNQKDKIIIFTQTKRSADEVSDFLISNNMVVGKIHGDLVQKARSATIQKFRENQMQYLVATDVVARGIDIDDVTLVINYELPQDIEYYIHRIGRTARGISNHGRAITLVTPNVYEREFRKYPKALSVDIKEIPKPTIGEVIDILKNNYKKEILQKDEVSDKTYLSLAKELLEFESETVLVSKLLKELYPQLSKEEHLKIVDNDSGNSHEQFKGGKGNNSRKRGRGNGGNGRSGNGKGRSKGKSNSNGDRNFKRDNKRSNDNKRSKKNFKKS